jgi:rubrerythrin
MYRISIQETAVKIKEAIQDERNDVILYENIAKIARVPEDKNIIESVVRDEREHVVTFRQLYKELTGSDFAPVNKRIETPQNYIAALKKSIFAEIEAIESYNSIFASLTNMRQKAIVSKVINDELKHLGEFNYLYTENKTR